VTDVLQRQVVAVNADGDRVVLAIGRHAMRFGYNTGFEIAQALRMAGKFAARVAGARPDERRAMAGADGEVPNAAGDSLAAKDMAGSPWSVRVEGERVALTIGNVRFAAAPQDALTIAGWVRTKSKEAKRNAGDRSRTVRVRGTLTDAAENYRRGYQ